MTRIAIIRIRGEANIRRDIKKTMHLLRLYRRHYCVVVDNKPNYVGMLNKIKDYVTWGELDLETFKMLLEKRGRIIGDKHLTNEYLKEKVKIDINEFANEFMKFKKEFSDVPGLKNFFRLSPPRKGFEKKGIKKPFSLGGALGYRKEMINELVKRML